MFHSNRSFIGTMTIISSLEKARNTKARMIEQGIKVIRKTPIAKWEEDKFSLRKSVDAKCWDCCHGDKESITHCTIKACPLWFVRPYQPKED